MTEDFLDGGDGDPGLDHVGRQAAADRVGEGVEAGARSGAGDELPEPRLREPAPILREEQVALVAFGAREPGAPLAQVAVQVGERRGRERQDGRPPALGPPDEEGALGQGEVEDAGVPRLVRAEAEAVEQLDRGAVPEREGRVAAPAPTAGLGRARAEEEPRHLGLGEDALRTGAGRADGEPAGRVRAQDLVGDEDREERAQVGQLLRLAVGGDRRGARGEEATHVVGRGRGERLPRARGETTHGPEHRVYGPPRSVAPERVLLVERERRVVGRDHASILSRGCLRRTSLRSSLGSTFR
jgi:hypothetical protein